MGAFHYTCSSAREAVWRKYSAESKAAWRCVICRTKTPTDGKDNECPADMRANPTSKASSSGDCDNTGSAQKVDEVSYLKELLKHKDIIIANQRDLVDSLKEQIRLLKLETSPKPTAVPKRNTVNARAADGPTAEKQSENTTTSQGPSISTKGDGNRQMNSRIKTKATVLVGQNGAGAEAEGAITNHDMHEALTRVKLQEVIHLNSDPEDNDQWRKVDYRKRRSRFIVGKKSDNSGCKLRAAEMQSHWHVCRLHPDTKQEEVVDYLKSDFPDIEVEKLNPSRPTLYSSFKITVKEEDGTKLLDADRWPSGARIRRFFLPRDG